MHTCTFGRIMMWVYEVWKDIQGMGVPGVDLQCVGGRGVDIRGVDGGCTVRGVDNTQCGF